MSRVNSDTVTEITRIRRRMASVGITSSPLLTFHRLRGPQNGQRATRIDGRNLRFGNLTVQGWLYFSRCQRLLGFLLCSVYIQGTKGPRGIELSLSLCHDLEILLPANNRYCCAGCPNSLHVNRDIRRVHLCTRFPSETHCLKQIDVAWIE